MSATVLEVGTGMHPEMTARENIYLNGAILGMKRPEITRKFDDIVDFAGCAMYVDTPVKRFGNHGSVMFVPQLNKKPIWIGSAPQ